MNKKSKKEVEEINRRVYNKKSLPQLKIIGRKMDLRNVDQYKKANKNVLVERIVKGRQLKDERKNVLLGIAQFKDLKVNDSMSKNVILQKITNPKLTDYKESHLRKLAEKKRNPFKVSNDKQSHYSKTQKPNKLLYCRIVKTFGS